MMPRMHVLFKVLSRPLGHAIPPGKVSISVDFGFPGRPWTSLGHAQPLSRSSESGRQGKQMRPGSLERTFDFPVRKDMLDVA